MYSAHSYKDVLTFAVEHNKGISGYKTKLAEAANCQKSYLSQVLKTHVHLTPDHAVGIADFWDFNSDQTNFFLNLVYLERAASPKLKKVIEERLEAERTRQKMVGSKYTDAFEINERQQAEFYLHWYVSAVYMLCGVCKTPTEISQRLTLPLDLISKSLSSLEDMGLVELKDNSFQKTQANIFLFEGSPFRTGYATAWRQVAGMKLTTHDPIRDKEDVFYTSLYSVSHEDRKKLTQLVMGFIEEVKTLTVPSSEEDLCCITMDYFTV
jgi:uncharacterized protein (TIGR02147 family)